MIHSAHVLDINRGRSAQLLRSARRSGAHRGQQFFLFSQAFLAKGARRASHKSRNGCTYALCQRLHEICAVDGGDFWRFWGLKRLDHFLISPPTPSAGRRIFGLAPPLPVVTAIEAVPNQRPGSLVVVGPVVSRPGCSRPATCALGSAPSPARNSVRAGSFRQDLP